MRLIALSALAGLSLATAPARADLSSDLARTGLTRTEAALAAKPDKSPNDLFALGAVQFLRGVERSLQTRWVYNAQLDNLGLPVLRLPVEPNPAPKPFEPGLITDLFRDLGTDMEAARTTLGAIPDGVELAVELDLAALWFDVNMNGVRDPDEEMTAIAVGSLMRPPTLRSDPPLPETQYDTLPVRFDTADLHWLIAYTHLLSGLSEMVIAFDPTEAIAEVLDARAGMLEILGDTPPRNTRDMRFWPMADQFAMAYGALNTPPDPAHTRIAHGHFLQMIAQNRLFWAKVGEEDDNTLEWIPNATQTAALGFELPPETGQVWQEVLADTEAVLTGERLVPFWRTAPAGGVDVHAMFMDPPAVDIVTWVQGAGLLPYMKRGPLANSRNLRIFERMISGDAMLFVFLLN